MIAGVEKPSSVYKQEGLWLRHKKQFPEGLGETLLTNTEVDFKKTFASRHHGQPSVVSDNPCCVSPVRVALWQSIPRTGLWGELDSVASLTDAGYYVPKAEM